MNKASDRASILVGVSLLEHSLERAIRTALRSPTKEEEEKALLFGETGIAGTLSKEINLAYFLGMIGPQTKRDMDFLRDIRNKAAHKVNQVTFETEPIRSWMRELRYLDKPVADPRMKFMTTITLMTSGLLVTAGYNSGEDEGSEIEDQPPDADVGGGEISDYVGGPRPGLPRRGGNLIVLLRR